MGKAERRAAKAAGRLAREAATAEALRDIPIIWCERTGRVFYHRGFYCEACKLYARELTSEADYEADWPDPRPTRPCDKCGESVRMGSKGAEDEFRRGDNGQLIGAMGDLPAGAVYEAKPWRARETLTNWVSNIDDKGRPFPEPPKGEGKRCRLIERLNKQDGRVLICILPDRTPWVIDSRANNCTLPLDDKHWCWIREGRPEDGTLNITKGGRTCSAGAGSIATGRYHGFLRHGRLVSC